MEPQLLAGLIENVSLVGFMAIMLQYFIKRSDNLYADVKKELKTCHEDKKHLTTRIRSLELRFLKGGT